LKPDTLYENRRDEFGTYRLSAPAIDYAGALRVFAFGIGGIHVPIGETLVDFAGKRRGATLC